MDRLERLGIFVRVAEASSFTKAAAHLQLPRSTVSTAIQGLEARIGVRLLNRTTRRVKLTVDGEAFYERGLRLLADFEEVETLFRRASKPAGKLRITVPGRIGRLIIAPALPGLIAACPDLELDLDVSDRVHDLVQGGIDCAVRVGHIADTRLVARPLGLLKLINCASPAYLKKHGRPRSTDDLSKHYAIHYVSPVAERSESWEFVDRGETRTLAMRARLTVHNAETYVACAVAGLGLIQVPAYDVRGAIRRNELVEVLPGARPAPQPIALVYPERRHLSRRLQAFVEWVEPLLRAKLVFEGAAGT